MIISRQTDTCRGEKEGKTEGKEAKVGRREGPQTQSRQAAEQDSGKAAHKKESGGKRGNFEVKTKAERKREKSKREPQCVKKERKKRTDAEAMRMERCAGEARAQSSTDGGMVGEQE